VSYARIIEAYWGQEDNIETTPFCEFSLPDDEFWSMKFSKRLAPDGSSSPPSLPHQLSNPLVEGWRISRRHSTVDDTDGKYIWTFLENRLLMVNKSLVPHRRQPVVRLQVMVLVHRGVLEARGWPKYQYQEGDTRAKFQSIEVRKMTKKKSRKTMKTPWKQTKTISLLPNPKVKAKQPKQPWQRILLEGVGETSDTDTPLGRVICTIAEGT